MSTVAVYIEGFAEMPTIAWAFVAPEHGYSASGVFQGIAGDEAVLLGRYRGAIEALQWALLAGYEKVLLHTDDPALAQQLGSSRPPQQGKLRHLWGELKNFEGLFFRVAYFWVEPELNTEARGLVKTTFEQHTGRTLDSDSGDLACLELLPIYPLAKAKGLEPAQFEDRQFLLWLIEAPTDSLCELNPEQARRLVQRLNHLTRAELFRLRVFYLRSLLGRAG